MVGRGCVYSFFFCSFIFFWGEKFQKRNRGCEMVDLNDKVYILTSQQLPKQKFKILEGRFIMASQPTPPYRSTPPPEIIRAY